jgi:hypothetical protein
MIRNFITYTFKISEDKMAGCVVCIGRTRNANKILVDKPAGRSPFGRHKRRVDDNIRMDLREIGCKASNWIRLARNRDQWRGLMNYERDNDLLFSIKGGEVLN